MEIKPSKIVDLEKEVSYTDVRELYKEISVLKVFGVRIFSWDRIYPFELPLEERGDDYVDSGSGINRTTKRSHS